jgi:hypothetical protein
MAHDHYISRSLTKPWRFGSKQLHCFDFETYGFDRPLWKDLYAKDYLNSPTLETWLRDVIETPLGLARPRLEAADPSALDDPKLFRATALMLMLQGLRTGTAIEEAGSEIEQNARRTLEELSAMPLREIDRLIEQYMNSRSLRLVFTPMVDGRWAPLSVPSTGIFSLYFPDRGCLSGWALGTALPIHPRCALVTTPVGDQSQMDFTIAAESLARRSVGNSNSRRVVLHRGLVDSMPAGQLRRRLRVLRKMNDDALDSFEGRRSMIDRTLALLGFSLNEDPAGRLSLR